MPRRVNMNRLHLRPLAEQVIVITGASSGIGLATARMAAEHGAAVVLAARNEEALATAAERIRQQGGRAVHVAADVGREDDVARIAETAVREFGRFDTWINNAAVSIFGQVDEVSIEDMRRMFDTNYWGVVHGSRAALKHFKATGGPGAIIMTGSVFGDRANPIQSTYASAKHAVHGWTDALRMEMEAEGVPVSVTLLHPGRIDTPYNEHAQSYLDQQPAHRGMIYPPEAVAEAALHAAAHPTRDLYVGSQAKAGALIAGLAPRLMDVFMELTMYATQHADRPSKPRSESALWKPGYGLHERGTHEGWIRGRSYFVKAEKHRGAVLAVLAGGAVLAGVRPAARALAALR
jgi:NAD(P)-dependent dehydrogenase (short-subunit alcohol dehydrogenase family)